MTLRNSKGTERDFDILFEVEKNDNKYVVYKDQLTGNLYGGKYSDDTLVVLTEDELEYLNKIIEKING